MSSSSGHSYELRDVEKQPNPAVLGVGDIPKEERPSYVGSMQLPNCASATISRMNLLLTAVLQATVLYRARLSTMVYITLRIPKTACAKHLADIVLYS